MQQQESCAKADLPFLDLSKVFVNVDPLYSNLSSGLSYDTDLGLPQHLNPIQCFSAYVSGFPSNSLSYPGVFQ